MSTTALLGLLGEEEVKRYSPVELEVLSEALVQAIDADAPARARLVQALADAKSDLATARR